MGSGKHLGNFYSLVVWKLSDIRNTQMHTYTRSGGGGGVLLRLLPPQSWIRKQLGGTHHVSHCSKEHSGSSRLINSLLCLPLLLFQSGCSCICLQMFQALQEIKNFCVGRSKRGFPNEAFYSNSTNILVTCFNSYSVDRHSLCTSIFTS